ncbi:nucleolar DEAD-box protein required for synthesis of 60S ribosomal subunit, partial [Coemansia erecta]
SESESEASSDSESEVDEMEEARKRAYFAQEDGQPKSDHPDSFTVMNLSRPIMKGLSKLNFSQPTPIQARTIPIALLGKDICGGAQTGSGKTAAFLVPILERLLYRPKKVPATRVLILCPTRELAIQCHHVAAQLAGFTDITTCLCVGGLSLKSQEAELRQRPDIVIATPGRLIDHLRNSQSFNIDQIEILIMDEADRMLEDGFEDELTEIIRACPRKRQTMLFSATMTDNVDKLIRLSLNKPVRVQIDPPKSAAKGLVQEFVRVRTNRDEDRTALLAALCKRHFKSKCIVFFRSKAAAHQMKIIFGLLGMKAGELHGNLTQEGRLQALE